MNVCPYIEVAFQVLGKKWNGQLIHYLSLCQNNQAHFSDIKKDLNGITSRALSIKLTELIEEGLITKKVESVSPVSVSYELTKKGKELATSLKPIQQWAMQYMDMNVKKEGGNENEPK